MDIIYSVFNLFTSNQPPEAKRTVPKIKGGVYRVTGVPAGTTKDSLGAVLLSKFPDAGITLDNEHTTICSSCYNKDTQTALVQFKPHPPDILNERLRSGNYQIPLEGPYGPLNIDKDFYGLTQLYSTKRHIRADIVAVSGINGHAYGSWRGRNDTQAMWLRHFFSDDFPDCRTMIYGYNSKLTDIANHNIEDYSSVLLEELSKSRQSEEERNRPIIFIGHSFGGIIIAQALVKASEMGSRHCYLLDKTHATIFFGTPHRGLVVDDILCMLPPNSPRNELVESINTQSESLKRGLGKFINLAPYFKIVSFYETKHTRKAQRARDGTYSRTGDYILTVERESSILGLPSSESLPVEGDHSTMVKFNSREDCSYTSVKRYIKDFVRESAGEEETAEDQSPILIGVMGVTGSGKSSFIQMVTGDKNIQIGHDLKSCTKEVKSSVLFEIDGRRVELVDTPGFNDDDMSDTAVLELICTWMSQQNLADRILHGILYLHPIGITRMDGASLRSLKLFGDISGKDYLRNTVMVTTMWDRYQGQKDFENCKQVEKSLINNFWSDSLDASGDLGVVKVVGGVDIVKVDEGVGRVGGAMYARSNNNKETCTEIIRRIVERTRKVPTLQQELNNGTSLDNTIAGKRLRVELDKMEKIHSQKIEDLLKKHNEAVEKERKSLAESYNEKIAAEKEKLERTMKEKEDLGRATEKMKQQHKEEMERQQERAKEAKRENLALKKRVDEMQSEKENLDTELKMKEEQYREEIRRQQERVQEQKVQAETEKLKLEEKMAEIQNEKERLNTEIKKKEEQYQQEIKKGGAQAQLAEEDKIRLQKQFDKERERLDALKKEKEAEYNAEMETREANRKKEAEEAERKRVVLEEELKTTRIHKERLDAEHRREMEKAEERRKKDSDALLAVDNSISTWAERYNSLIKENHSTERTRKASQLLTHITLVFQRAKETGEFMENYHKVRMLQSKLELLMLDATDREPFQV